MPLIIKVASIPKERIQVYFIDNEEYFKRKATFADENGKLFEDNDERAIFFAKGVVETVKKLNWAPDIIHVHGWLAALLPVYLRNYYASDPLFAQSKIVTSVYNQGYEGSLNKEMINKIAFDGIDADSIEELKDPTYENLMKVSVKNSDAAIIGSPELNEDLGKILNTTKIPVLPFKKKEEFPQAYEEFYTTRVLEE